MSPSKDWMRSVALACAVLSACDVGAVEPVPEDPLDGLRVGDSTVWYSPMQFTGRAGSLEAALNPELTRLFDQPNSWSELRGRTKVFPLYILALQDDAGPNRDRTITSDAELQRMASAINSWGLQVAIEVRGFRGQAGSRPDGCDSSTGEKMAAREIRYIERWVTAGGRVDIIAYDSPIGNALFGGGEVGPPPECKPPIDTNFMIGEIADHAKAIAARFPNARLTYTDSPVYFPFDQYGAQIESSFPNLRGLIDGLVAAFTARGVRLDTYIADWAYGYASINDGWRKISAIRSYLQSKSVKFGMFCTSDLNRGQRTGLGAAEDDAQNRREVMACWGQAAANGIEVSDLILQNWHEWPARSLPETERATSTNVALETLRRLGDSGILGLACGGATPSQRGQCHPTSIGQRCSAAAASTTAFAWAADSTCLSGVQCGGANPAQRGQCSTSSLGQRCTTDPDSPTSYGLHNDASCGGGGGGGGATWQLHEDCRPNACVARDCTTPAIGTDVTASGIGCSTIGQVCNTPSGARSFVCRP
jgi:hypothetical protein